MSDKQSNSDNEKIIEFHFAGYRISKTQQLLFKNNEKISISTKAYYLLLFLLENHGQILNKDSIIEAVWPGQIVTDTALTKQVIRLRNLLGDNDSSNPMIETHRGVGYRFASKVTVQPLNAHKPSIKPLKAKKKTAISSKKTSISTAIVAMVLLATMALFYYQKEQTKPIEDESKTQLNLAIVPDSQERDWLNNGGLNYLSDLLDSSSFIQSIQPRQEWYTTENSDALAIELTSNKNISYAVIVAIKQQENNTTAQLKLRNNEKLIDQVTLNEQNISQLLSKSKQWIVNRIATNEHINAIRSNEKELFSTVDNYALESYLQGLFQQEVDSNQQKANDYFQAAVNKDGQFVAAWVKLLESDVYLGHYNKALAIGENILNTFSEKISTIQTIKTYYLLGFSHFRLRNEEKAQASLQQSISFIKDSSNPFTKLEGLKSLNLLAYLQRDWPAAEDYALQRIALAKDYYPYPNYMAGMYLFLSEIVSYQNKTNQALDYLYKARDYYEKVNSSNGMITVLAGLNRMNLQRNKLDDGVLLTQQAAIYLQNNSNPDKAMFYLFYSSFILNLRGYFDKSSNYTQQMEKLANRLNNPLYFLITDTVKLHKYYVQHQFAKAKNHLESMRSIFNDQQAMTADLSAFYLFDMLISARVDSAQEALKKYNDYLEKHPELKQNSADDLARILGHIYVKSGKINAGIKMLVSAENGYREKQGIGLANYIAYEALEVLLHYPELEYQSILQRVEANTTYDYLFFKLKAQFLAREKNYLQAAILMRENKQKANQLWQADDQLLLEDYQFKSKNQ